MSQIRTRAAAGYHGEHKTRPERTLAQELEWLLKNHPKGEVKCLTPKLQEAYDEAVNKNWKR